MQVRRCRAHARNLVRLLCSKVRDPTVSGSRPHLINVVEAVAADDDVICHLNHGVALN